MAAKIVLLLAACFALSAGGMVRRDAPASDPWADIQKNALELQKTFADGFNSVVNSKNTEEVTKVLKDGSESVLQGLSSFSSSLQGALGDVNGKAKDALEQTRQNLQKTVEDLRKAHPDVEKQAVALKQKLQTAVDNALRETHALAEKVSANVSETNQKLAPKVKAAFDDFVKQAEEVQKKIQEAASKQ